MSDHPLGIADVLRRFLAAYLHRFALLMMPSQHRAVRDILACMTAAMGGHRYQCNDCHETFWIYHGCRNRACPRCHARQTQEWLDKRDAQMLPGSYFHLVATIPAQLRGLFLQHQKYLYGLLMKTVAAALIELAQEKRYLGATPAIMAVLHTWTARLLHHPHVHLLISAGGLSGDGSSWIHGPKKFLVPVKKLSPRISKLFAETLKKERPELFDEIPQSVWNKPWCSFCKPCGNGYQAVLRYLARYVFRSAITDHRILAMDDSQVTFRYKDSNSGAWNTERLSGLDFIQRFLLHVLPKGFHKVRYYGLWSPARSRQYQQARNLLLLASKHDDQDQHLPVADIAEDAVSQSLRDPFVPECPNCAGTNLSLLCQTRRGGYPMVA